MESTSFIACNSSTARERLFVECVNTFIKEELSYLQSNELSKERFIIFKQAFDKILDFVQAYKFILSSIKREYELCIDALERGQIEAKNMKREMNNATTAPQTILTLEKQKEELLQRISLLKKSNKKLLENLDILMIENDKLRPKKEVLNGRFSFLNNLGKPRNEQQEETKRTRVLGNLEIDQATNIDYLNEILNKLEFRLRELSVDQKTKYSMKMRKNELRNALMDKVATRDDLQLKNDSLKMKLHLYKIALQAAKGYYNGSIEGSNIQKVLTRAIFAEKSLKHNKSTENDDQNGNEQVANDDNILESEAEYILDYIDKFNEIFANGKYREAADFAAASPRNVLRNIETFQRFQSVSSTSLHENDPLFIYATAILDSTNTDLSKPTKTLSIECIKVILSHERVDLLTRYIAQRKILFSKEAAQIIDLFAYSNKSHEKKSIELSLFIYNDIDCPFEAMVCLAKLERFTAMFDKFNSNYDEDVDELDTILLNLLKECPTLELANFILTKANDFNLSFDQIFSTLDPLNQLKFLQLHVQRNRNDNENSNEADDESQTTDENSESLPIEYPIEMKKQLTHQVSIETTHEDEVYDTLEIIKSQEFIGEEVLHSNFHKFDGKLFDDDDEI